jgi:hemolysin activation/secretion protein
MAWPAPLDDVLRLQEQALRQQETRREELRREHREALTSPPKGETPEQLELRGGVPGGPCLDTKSVTFSGVTVLGTRELQALTAAFVGRCLTLEDVDNLLRAVTNAYIGKGYVTTRAMISPRGYAGGNLDILVVEGRVEGVGFAGAEGTTPGLRTAFPGMSGSVLNIRDIEQGLDQLNRLPSNNATVELVPGGTPGTTNVRISNQPTKTWRASVGLDNSGQPATGRDQYLLHFSKDNLLGLSDLLSLSMNADLRGLQGHSHRSKAFNAIYSVPYGWWTFTGSLGFSDYASSVSGAGVEYGTKGDSTSAALDIDRVIHRDAVSKTAIGASLTRRDTRNFLEDQKLETSSRTLTSLGISVSHSRRLAGGVAQGRVEWAQGLPILGAEGDHSLGNDEPRSQFSKFALSVSYQRMFRLCGADLTWSTQAFGQWSPHTLPGAERLGIGSRDTVRGFHEESLSGDIGAYIRNELALNVFDAARGPSILSSWVDALDLYVGYDAGFIRPDDKEDEERGEVQGVTAGARSTGGSLITDIAVSHALDAPSFLEHDGLEVYATFKYAF